MTKKKTGLLIGIIACLVLFAALAFFLLGKSDKTSGEMTTYTVEVQTEGSMPISDVSVFVYENSKLVDLVWVAKTDDKGKITFDAAKSNDYVAVLKDVPEGYASEDSYALKDVNTVIQLKTALKKEDDLTKITYELGDVIYDFSVTAPDGTVYTISELLKEKKAVVLNFWYLECGPCKTEFPFLQEAYEQFSDELIVLAMNPINKDDKAIADFQKSMGITFPMMQCDSEWEQTMQIKGYPTTVVIDRYGVISLIHTGAITNAESFVEIFEHYAAENYTQEVIKDMEEIVTYEEEEGSVGNAIELGGVDKFDAKVKPGKVVYYDLYKVSGMNLQIKDADAYVIYGEETYRPSNGIVSVKVTSPDTFTPVKVGIGNSGKSEKTFHVPLVFDGGTQGNPYSMSLGEFTTNVKAGNNQGVYYTYKSPKEGILTLQCISATSGVEYDYVLYNLNSYAYRTKSSDNANSGGIPTVTVPVKAGQTVQVIVSTLPDSSNAYPAGTFKFKAFFKEEKVEDTVVKDETITYSITVKDENDKMLSGVWFYVKTGESTEAIVTNTDGVAKVKLAPGTYDARLALPEGYTSKTTQYYLTDKEPNISVTIKPIPIEMEDYKVTVIDAENNPISNVTISIGDIFKTTDDLGVVTFNLKKGSYSAVIGVPEGFTSEKIEFSFEDKTELTIVLEPEAPTVQGIDYQVTVVDVTTNILGTPLTGVAVRFVQEGEQKALQQVDSNGVAKATLPEGEYAVEVAFGEGSNLSYVKNITKLSVEKPTVVIPVAKFHDGASTMIWDEYYVRKVPQGGTYVEMISGATNYFMLEVSEPGLYSITTTDANAKIADCGNSNWIVTFPNWDSAENTLPWNIKPTNLQNRDSADFIFAISGVTECIVKIERLGDAILGNEDQEYKEYVGNTTPGQPYTFPGGSLTYVDLTASSDTYNLVLGSDGYYHLNSSTGPIMYVNLDYNKYVSFDDMINGFGAGGGTGFKYMSYEGGVLIKEDYTNCMISYIANRDSRTNLYPLTEDLVYMIQKGGAFKGWWDSTNSNYLFNSVVNLNTEIAWMFACCYVQ